MIKIPARAVRVARFTRAISSVALAVHALAELAASATKATEALAETSRPQPGPASSTDATVGVVAAHALAFDPRYTFTESSLRERFTREGGL